MGFRLNVIVFGTFICILTAASLATTIYRVLVILWLYPILLVAWALVFAVALDYFVIDKRLSRKKLLFLTFGLIILSSGVTHVVWVVATPNWFFSVTTNKSTYTLSEEVKIKVILRNDGFITHSFKSGTSDPFVIEICTIPGGSMKWYSTWHLENMTFSLAPKQTLERDFTWNQTDVFSAEPVEKGEYSVTAYVYDENLARDVSVFTNHTHINII